MSESDIIVDDEGDAHQVNETKEVEEDEGGTNSELMRIGAAECGSGGGGGGSGSNSSSSSNSRDSSCSASVSLDGEAAAERSGSSSVFEPPVSGSN